MFTSNPLFLIIFFNIHFLLQLLCFAENTIKIVFSEEPSFSKIQIVKTTLSPIPKTPFQKKKCHFWFWTVSAETTIFIVFPGFHCFGFKNILAATDSVHENSRLFSLPDTNSVRQFLLKFHFFIFLIFG